jgi:hypothetical protein
MAEPQQRRNVFLPLSVKGDIPPAFRGCYRSADEDIGGYLRSLAPQFFYNRSRQKNRLLESSIDPRSRCPHGACRAAAK